MYRHAQKLCYHYFRLCTWVRRQAYVACTHSDAAYTIRKPKMMIFSLRTSEPGGHSSYEVGTPSCVRHPCWSTCAVDQPCRHEATCDKRSAWGVREEKYCSFFVESGTMHGNLHGSSHCDSWPRRAGQWSHSGAAPIQLPVVDRFVAAVGSLLGSEPTSTVLCTEVASRTLCAAVVVVVLVVTVMRCCCGR